MSAGVGESQRQIPACVGGIDDRREKQVADANQACHALLELGSGCAILVNAAKIDPQCYLGPVGSRVAARVRVRMMVRVRKAFRKQVSSLTRPQRHLEVLRNRR